MMGPRSAHTVKHKLLILLYLICLTLSLSPTIVAPPEKSFSQGQPEMQQAMDNMVAHEAWIKKSLEFPQGDVEGYPALLTSKTSHLLSEAEHMLNRVKNVKERRWVEAFVHRMKILSSTLEKSIIMQDEGQQNISGIQASTTPSSTLAPSFIPEKNSSEKTSGVAPKYSVTSPKVNQVLPVNGYPIEQHTVPKLKPSQNSHFGLLRYQRNRYFKPLQRFYAAMPSADTKSQELPAGTIMMASKRVYSPEEEEARLKERLSQEMAELHRMGATEEDLRKFFHFDDNSESKNPNLVLNQKPNVEEKIKFETQENKLADEETLNKLSDLKNNDEIISKTNPSIWKPIMNDPHPEAELVPKPNTFQHIHINMPKLTSKVLSNHLGNNHNRNAIYQHHGSLDNAIHNLQQPNKPHFTMKNPMFAIPKGYTNGQPQRVVNGALNHKPDLSSRFPPSYYPQYYNRHVYRPYPYMDQWDLRNSTLHAAQTLIPSFLTKPNNDHQIDAHLSEEMKRQLRDGKIIVLSDSLVRSNFEPKKEKDTEVKNDESEKENTIKKKEADGMKSTQAQN